MTRRAAIETWPLRSPPRQSDFWPQVGFALAPLAALLIGAAIEARGAPTPAAFFQTLEVVGETLATTPSP